MSEKVPGPAVPDPSLIEADRQLNAEKQRLSAVPKNVKGEVFSNAEFARSVMLSKVESFQKAYVSAFRNKQNPAGPAEQRAMADAIRQLHQFLSTRARTDADTEREAAQFAVLVMELERRVSQRSLLIEGRLADKDRARATEILEKFEADRQKFVDAFSRSSDDDALLFCRAVLDDARDPDSPVSTRSILSQRQVLSRIVQLPGAGRIISEAIEDASDARQYLDHLPWIYSQPWGKEVMSAIMWQLSSEEVRPRIEKLPPGRHRDEMLSVMSTQQHMKRQLEEKFLSPNPQPRNQIVHDRALRHVAAIDSLWQETGVRSAYVFSERFAQLPADKRDIQLQAQVSRYLSYRRLPPVTHNIIAALNDIEKHMDKFWDTKLFEGGDVLYLSHSELDPKTGNKRFGVDAAMKAMQHQLDISNPDTQRGITHLRGDPEDSRAVKGEFLRALSQASPRDTVMVDSHAWYRDGSGRVQIRLGNLTEELKQKGVTMNDVCINPKEFADAIRQRSYEKGRPFKIVFTMCVSADFMTEMFEHLRGCGKSILCVSETEYGQTGQLYTHGNGLGRQFYENVLRLEGNQPTTIGSIAANRYAPGSSMPSPKGGLGFGNNSPIWYLDEEGTATQVVQGERREDAQKTQSA